MTWDKNRIARLRELWSSGASASQIAAALGPGVSRNAVIGMAHRLGLSARTSGSGPPLPNPGARRRPTSGSLALADDADPPPQALSDAYLPEAEAVPHATTFETDAANAVRKLRKLPHHVLADLRSQYSTFHLFGIDSDPVTYKVENGSFEGRAVLLLDLPMQTRSGAAFDGSTTRRVRVRGRIVRPGKVSVDDMDLLSARGSEARSA